MWHDIEKHCRGKDGKPDFELMARFMDHHHRGSTLEACGWALFFIWIGVAWLANLGTGLGILGVAVIVIGVQLLRKMSGLRVEGFWLFVGFALLIGAFWELFNVQTPLAPLVLILIGIALFVSVLRSRSRR